jgi:hypothetical protein
MQRDDTTKMIPHFLAVIPGIVDAFNKADAGWVEGQKGLSSEDKRILLEIQQKNNIPFQEKLSLPITQFLEDLVVPHIMLLILDPNKQDEVRAIFSVAEEFTKSSVFDFRNAIGVSFCDPIITGYEDQLPLLVPYIGPCTWELFQLRVAYWITTPESKELFGVGP